MPVIRGHVESIVNRRTNPLSLVVTTRTLRGTSRIECVVGEKTKMARGFERLRMEEIRPGEFVAATFREHASRLGAERIDAITFTTGQAGGLREETNQLPDTTGGTSWR